jgi:hypothetical protein
LTQIDAGLRAGAVMSLMSRRDQLLIQVTCAELSNRLLLPENADADEIVIVETLDVAGFVLD